MGGDAGAVGRALRRRGSASCGGIIILEPAGAVSANAGRSISFWYWRASPGSRMPSTSPGPPESEPAEAQPSAMSARSSGRRGTTPRRLSTPSDICSQPAAHCARPACRSKSLLRSACPAATRSAPADPASSTPSAAPPSGAPRRGRARLPGSQAADRRRVVEKLDDHARIVERRAVVEHERGDLAERIVALTGCRPGKRRPAAARTRFRSRLRTMRTLRA